MELGVLFEQWNSKNECILLCFGFVLPLGAAGFSPCYPILMVSSISASPLFSWFFLWEEGSMNSSFIPLWDTDCPQLSVWCCTLVQELRGGDWGASRDLHLWGRWVEPSLKPLLRASAKPSLRGWCNWDRRDFPILGSFKAGEKLWKMLWKQHSSSWEIICPWTAEGGVAKGI